MAFCPNCGTSVDGRFCAKCGASVGPDSAAPAGSPSSTPPPPGAATSGMTDNVAGCLAYIPIVGIIFLLNNLEVIRLYQVLRYWPVVLILLGAYLLYVRVSGARQDVMSPPAPEVGRE